MYTNKQKFLLIAIVALLSSLASEAQTTVKKDTVNRRRQTFVLHLGGGVSSYIAAVKIKPNELDGSINRSSVAATARLMWYPNHRLRFGIETGFTNFYSYKVKNGNATGKLSLYAIPILFVWSMPIVRRVDLFAGFGTYILNTHLKYSGEVNSKAVALGSNIAVSYTYPFTKRMGLAAEAKWMNAFETKDAALSFQVQMIWKFIQL